MGRRTALLIATYDYQDTGLQRLTSPAHDAEALAAVLQDPDIAGFEVTTLVNQPHHRVGEAIGDFYRDRRNDDLTLLYFTGHGLKDDDGRLYLAMSNTRRDSMLFTALSAEQIDQAMEGCVSRQKVLILDCCYSGAFPAGRIAKADTAVHTLERFQGRGRTVLTASDATQYSFEGNQAQGHAPQSVFTRYLVAGLRDGSADLDGDGDITLDELYSYVHDRVVEEMPQQRPKKQDNVAGRIVIARNSNWTLPTHLSNALGSPIATDRLGALDGLAHLYQIGNGFVRQRVASEIQHLADDDSRRVSAAAAARLKAIQPPAPESAPGSASDPAPPPATAVATQSAPVTQTSPPAATPESPPARVQGRGARIWKGVRGTDAWQRIGGPVRSRALVGLTGLLPILAAALLVAGYATQPYSNWFASTNPDLSYAITMAAVMATTGACVLLPRTRSLIGPGVVLGATAASVWWLVYFSLLKPDPHSGTAYQRYFAGHVALVLGACLAGLVLKRNQAVRFKFWRPTDLRAWIMAILAGLAAVACVFALSHEAYQAAHVSALSREYGNADWTDSDDYASYADYLASLAWGYLAAAVAAVSVLVLAAVVAPRRFRLSLLAGWLGGASAIAHFAYASVANIGGPSGVARHDYLYASLGTLGTSNGSYTDAIIFGCALLVLAAVGVVTSLRSPR